MSYAAMQRRGGNVHTLLFNDGRQSEKAISM